MKKLIVLAACAVLAGCAARVVANNERSVTVRAGSAQAGMAQEAADAECRKHGRIARLSLRPTPNEFTFDCVH